MINYIPTIISASSKEPFRVSTTSDWWPLPKPTEEIQKENSEAHTFLHSLNIFSELPATELTVLANSCRFATFAAGHYISTEGQDESLYGFIVVSGRLSMMKTSITGKELVVELLAPGEMLGLLVALATNKSPIQLSVRAQAESKVLWVPIKVLNCVLNNHPILYKEFFAHLLECLHSSYRISRGLAHDKVEVRIASVLSNLALKFSRPFPAIQDQTIDITRQQIADLAGTTSETAIRVTRSMQRAGLIDIKRPGIVRVLDLHGLQNLAEH